MCQLLNSLHVLFYLLFSLNVVLEHTFTVLSIPGKYFHHSILLLRSCSYHGHRVVLRVAWAQDLGNRWAVDPVWTNQSPHSGSLVSDTTQSSQSEFFFSIFKLQLGREGSFSSWVKNCKDMNPKMPLVCEVNSWKKWSRDQSWKVLTYVLYNLVFCIWWMNKHISEQTYILARGWVASK